MMELEEITSPRALEPRLTRRRALEDKYQKGWPGYARGDFLLWKDRLTAALLKATLKISGLYDRGVANALCSVVRHLRLEFAELPPHLSGFRILHLSDLHIDGVEGLAEILADHVSDLPVDLCVMTGDYRFKIEGPCHAVYPRMRRIVDSIRARHGVVGILGNHDCADIAVTLEKVGVRMLINEAVAAGAPDHRLWVIGVDDPHYYGCDDLAGALDGVPDDAFKLLLAHTPEMFGEAAEAGIDLYLTGHTHAGQICLPWLGPLVSHATCPRQYTYGHWQHGGMQGYTTAGAGCSLLPVRFQCPPEICVIELASLAYSHSRLEKMDARGHRVV
jgi:predicted MPP superfamily phosphohydrolase